MTLYEFNDLDEAEQHEVLWETGVMVGEKVEGEYKIILYQVFSFYAELYYHTELNVLRMLTSFSSTESLDAYIGKFNITNHNG